MDIQTLSDRIAPRLNHLLTEPPFSGNGGVDFGWYCREHSVVTKIVCERLGFQCDIVRGHVSVYVAGKQRLTTAGTDSDHVWCSINGVTPCDLSMTFRHFEGYPQLKSAILGCENNGSYGVAHLPLCSQFPNAIDNRANGVYFAPSIVLQHSSQDYISDPTLLVGNTESGTITLAIAAYLSQLLDGQEQPLDNLPQCDSLKMLLAKYPSPRHYLA